MTKNVRINILSLIDGEATSWQTTGEYDYNKDEQTHLVAYKDYTSNDVTMNGLHIGKKSMLVHRTGAITSDMYFDTENTTFTHYNTFGLETMFIIDTFQYELSENENEIKVFLRYTLDDESGADKIQGVQEITITNAD